MKFFIFISIILNSILNSANIFAQEVKEDDIYNLKKYVEDAQKDAKNMITEFERLDKPKYKKAFDEYQEDLKTIAITGRAPDNYELYKDLESMNSNELKIFAKSKKTIHTLQ